MIQPAFEILNQRGTPMFFSDVFANRPTAGIVGRIFISTDTYAFYRDTGSGWDLIGGPGTGTITGSGTIGTLPIWNGTQVIGDSSLLEGSTKFTTTKDFQADGYYLTGMTGGNGALYWTSDRVTLANYNATGNVVIEAGGGQNAQTISGTDLSTTFYGNIIRNGGLSTQFLKADGSLDSSAYVTTNIYNSNGTITGNRVVSLNSNYLSFAGGQTYIGSQTASSGLLTINNSSSDAHIQVVGASAPSIRIDNAGTGATQRLVFGLATATNNFIQGSTAGDICISTASASPLLFGMWQTINASEVMRISTANNVIIGSSLDNGTRFQVTGAATFSSSVTASGGASGVGFIMTNTTNSIQVTIGYTSGEAYNYIQAYDGTNFQRLVLNGSLSLAGSGAATFSSSVTATSGIFTQSAGNSLQVYQTAATNSTTAIIRQTGAGGNGGQDIGLLVDIQGANDLDNIANFRYYDGSTYTSRMVVKRGGSVGIGTSTPARIFTIFGGALTSRIILQNTATGQAINNGLDITMDGTNAQFWNYQNGYTAFATNNIERARISADGLRVFNAVRINKNGTFFGADATRGVLEIDGTTDSIFALTTNNTTRSYFYYSSSILQLVSDTNYQMAIGGSTAMYMFSSSQNIYIGTGNNPTDTGDKLRLNGSFRIDGQTSGTAGGSSGQHLIINCDGTTYKIALLNN